MNKKTDHSLSDGDFSVILQQRVNNALVETVYKQINVGIFAALGCATVIFTNFYLYSLKNLGLLIAWYFVFWGISIVRLFLAKAYFNQADHENNIAKWRNLFIVGAIFGGLSWGFVGSILLPYNNVMSLLLCVLILTGVTAGAVPLLSAVFSASITFLLCALIPFFISLLFIGDITFLYYDGAVFIYMIYLVLLSYKSYRVTKHAITLQYQNDILLRHLTEAKEELEAANKKLAQSATNDSLTQLLNRHTFEKELAEIITQAKWKQNCFALLCLDLDKFKEINDTYGHQIGDLLLQKIAERLKRILPKNCLSARTGGDEFVIVFEDITNPNEIGELAQRICSSVAMPFEIQDYIILETISIGISIFPIDGINFETLFKNANKALQFVKENNGNNYHFNTDSNTIKTALMNTFSKLK